MKRYLLMICAAVALVCSCDKYGGTIDELNKRLDSVEEAKAMLVSKVEAMQVLANAKSSQITIRSIETVADGLKVAFSDGKEYIIADGQNDIKVTDDATSYTFDFGDGTVISVMKNFSFALDSESYEVPAASDVVIKYTINADDGTVHVTAKALDGCKVVSVDEENAEITVRAAGRVGEHLVSLRAIRNSDGQVCEKIASVVSGPRAPIALEGAMSAYYGESVVSGVDNYYTQFYKGDVDEDNYFVGEAYSLLFDFWTPISDIMSLPAGVYVPEDTYAEFTFTIGEDTTLRETLEEDLWLYQLFFGVNTVEELAELLGYSVDQLDELMYSAGAELYHQFSSEEGDYEDYAITEGTVSVSLSGTQYSVTMNICLRRQLRPRPEGLSV